MSLLPIDPTNDCKRQSTGYRWLKFNMVGGMGIGVQMLVLMALKTGLGLDYLVATLLAVEGAIVHNFLWHERFTWRRQTPIHDGVSSVS